MYMCLYIYVYVTSFFSLCFCCFEGKINIYCKRKNILFTYFFFKNESMFDVFFGVFIFIFDKIGGVVL
jgi:hypothetical protein